MSKSDISAKRAEAVAAIKLHDRLVVRAKKIVTCAPYLVYQCDLESEWYKVSIAGNTAMLSVHKDSSSYDGGSWNEGHEFPAHLLFVSAAELAAWQAEQRALIDKENAETEAREARLAETRERAALAALKAKYEKA